MPNGRYPCEWHFQFGPLAGTERSRSILTGNGHLRWRERGSRWEAVGFSPRPSLAWRNEGTNHADHLFSTLPFVPNLRSLTYVGGWSSLIAQVTNLTSFFFDSDSRPWGTNTEAFRLFMRGNRSLESLHLKWIDFEVMRRVLLSTF